MRISIENKKIEAVNQFDGEPNNHMQEGIEVIFEPARDTWD